MLSLEDNPHRIIVQAVNELVEKLTTSMEWTTDDRFIRMIFIGQFELLLLLTTVTFKFPGRHLDRDTLFSSFMSSCQPVTVR